MTLGRDLVERCLILDQLKINKPTQIEPVKEPSPRTFEDKEIQVESIQYYDIENARETPGQGSPDLYHNGGQPNPWNPVEDAVTELAYHGLSEPAGFLGEELESRISLKARTLYYKRLFDW